MTLAPGTKLGPYEILGPLGSGGMGEVYRARDSRLGREVAIKTLPAAFARDAERRARFESEARAIAALSHPNVLALHDLGRTPGEDGSGETVYAVMELVEGVTLRERLVDGPLSGPRAVAIAIQVARGLAAAHDRGIVHRDLKPENVMITADGHAKILDFGLAKRVLLEGSGSQSLAPTIATGTEPGMVLGTVGYMAPEQVRGQAADARSDLFALGCLLHEMIAGRRAFAGESPAETMSAILREEPADLTVLVPGTSTAIERIVRRCLEKNPVARFRSAADLGFALEAIASASSAPSASGESPVPASPSLPTFKRVTYRNGHVAGARFTPDGGGIVFGASWEGSPYEIYSCHPGSPEARSLRLPPGTLLAMSPSGEMALSTGFHYRYWLQVSGTLARVPLAGGGVRPLQKDVGAADWSPDGKSLAVIRYAEGRCRLEYPAGKLLFETSEWLSEVRVSPDARHVAFAYHPTSGDSGGDLCVVDTSGNHRVLGPGMTSLAGIAWSPSGDEVWYSGINEQERHGIWGVSLDGRRREIHTSSSRVMLHDVARDGRMLMSMGILRAVTMVGGEEGVRESDLSWFDGSIVMDFTPDGRQILFSEVDEAENPHYATYLRDVDGSPAVRLGEGTAARVSPDGNWVLAVLNRPAHGLMMYPTGIGEPRSIAFDGIDHLLWAGFHPDGRHLFAVGSTPSRPNRLYRLSIEGGAPQLLWDEEIEFDRVFGVTISPDGERLALRRHSGAPVMFSCASGSTEPLAGIGAGDHIIRFDERGESLYVARRVDGRSRIERLDLATGERRPWREVRPPDPTGILYASHPIVSPDGLRYAYSFIKIMSDLYVVQGLG